MKGVWGEWMKSRKEKQAEMVWVHEGGSKSDSDMLAACLLLSLVSPTHAYPRPIVGVMTQPYNKTSDTSYIAASYVGPRKPERNTITNRKKKKE
jgi:hypothetical protein